MARLEYERDVMRKGRRLTLRRVRRRVDACVYNLWSSALLLKGRLMKGEREEILDEVVDRYVCMCVCVLDGLYLSAMGVLKPKLITNKPTSNTAFIPPPHTIIHHTHTHTHTHIHTHRYDERASRLEDVRRHFQLLPSRLDRMKLLHELAADHWRGLLAGLAVVGYLF